MMLSGTQFSEQQLIGDTEVPGRLVIASAADLDGDGDADVLVAYSRSASAPMSRIVWRENTDGRGTLGPERLVHEDEITLAFVDYDQVSAVDLDGDRDLDILSMSSIEGREHVIWLQNSDGRGSFDLQPALDVSSTPSLQQVLPADLDRDGDVDLVVRFESKITWYRNVDGMGDFGGPNLVSQISDDISFTSVTPVDLDRDGDLDLLTTLRFGPTSWFENTDGRGTFGASHPFMYLPTPYTMVDLDGDSDLDVLSAHADTLGDYYRLAWFENTDGDFNFGPKQQIDWYWYTWPAQIRTADFDQDGDLDVLTFLASRDEEVVWYENLSGDASVFGAKQVIAVPEFLRFGTIDVADLDNDGDEDVLTANSWHDVLAWHENLLPHPGDANRDGRFDTNDLIQVLQIGEYEDGIEDNSTWEEGDWNGDGDFDSADLVIALETGLYEVKSGLYATKVAAAVDWLFTQDNAKRNFRAFVA